MRTNRACVPGLTGLIILTALGHVSLAAAQGAAVPAKASAASASAGPAAPAAPTEDIGWPRQLVKDGATRTSALSQG